MVKIENEFLTAEINLHGAELSSLVAKADGTEYMWQADPAVWARHAPVLFPIVGALKDDQYTYQDKTYHMTRHGFARDLDFAVAAQSADQVSLVLTDNDETHAKYPFAFKLTLTYKLDGQNLHVGYKVENPADDKMLFSIGAHPAFRMPLSAGRKFEDFSLDFEPAKTRTRVGLQGKYADFANGKPVDENHTPLTRELFKGDALIYVLDGDKTKLSLSSPDDEHGVSLTVKDAPYVGVWSNYPTPGDFCCIEPWWGVADEPSADGQLEHKRGIRELAGGKSFEAGFTISTH
ncbi:aldose 1-epimerase family protein [Lacticaseibacillus songhuajiangensis]|jgi:galactose mutarotase-like enzyme|uniref:aldose 1-epimerase family protein n=1 Tax=Lacticaseibacillus songhuajiangensis TaxID=1296539 RepID=UPI000F78AEA5|nr:aldose 1-epimerase family protein [Lacticaseibacillus songhuajiangensis]